MFLWRKPVGGYCWRLSIIDALKQICELQRMLGKKTVGAEDLKEAVEIAWSPKWITRSPLLPVDDGKLGFGCPVLGR